MTESIIQTKSFLVGIAGGTASGKTTLAQQLVKIGGDDRVALIELDRYYRSQEHLTDMERSSLNYDHPAALEFDLLIDHLTQLKCGKTINAPLYDFATHCRDPIHTTPIAPRSIIIVEGILVLADSVLCALFDLRIFVETPDDTRLMRRIERDLHERGRSIESVHTQWSNTVLPMHQKFCQPSKSVAEIVIDGRDNLQTVSEALWALIWERSCGHDPKCP